MIQESTLAFLKALAKNNNKEWFDKNRGNYELAKSNFIELISKVIVDLGKSDPAIAGQEAKKCVFRINRDIRFSANKTPYKNNFGASISPGGKSSFLAGYYIQLQPGNSFLAGGMWQPESPQLNAIRQEIDYNGEEFSSIISKRDFKKYFGGLSQEDMLKTVPKGYPKDHPQIEFLKLKSFVAVHGLTDKQVLSKDFSKHCVQVFKSMTPLNAFLRRACD